VVRKHDAPAITVNWIVAVTIPQPAVRTFHHGRRRGRKGGAPANGIANWQRGRQHLSQLATFYFPILPQTSSPFYFPKAAIKTVSGPHFIDDKRFL